VIYALLSNISIALCFVPLLLLWFKKLQYEKAYLFTAIYWLANGLMNLPGWIGQSGNKALLNQVTLLYNILDAPMVLLVFLFSVPQGKRKPIFYTLCGFIFFEIVMVAWKGYNLSSSIVIIGVGTFMAITFSVISVMEYLQKIEHTSFENTMVFVYASFLFAYGIFIVIYLFSYLKIVESSSKDNFLIYYTSLLLSTLLTCLGLWRYAGKPEPNSIGSINSMDNSKPSAGASRF
jgi:hypothetical protein